MSFLASDGIERLNEKLAIAYLKLLGFLRALKPSEITSADERARIPSRKAMIVIATTLNVLMSPHEDSGRRHREALLVPCLIKSQRDLSRLPSVRSELTPQLSPCLGAQDRGQSVVDLYEFSDLRGNSSVLSALVLMLLGVRRMSSGVSITQHAIRWKMYINDGSIVGGPFGTCSLIERN